MVGLLPFIIILFCCMYINVKLLERVIFFFLVFYIFDNSCFIDFYPIAEEFRHCNQGFTALGYCCNLKVLKRNCKCSMLIFFCYVVVIDKTPAKPTKGNLPRNRSFGTFQREFHMGDAVEFCVNGVEVKK